MEYIKLHEKTEEFNEVEVFYPSLNLLNDTKKMYIERKPSSENFFTAIYNITQISGDTQILGVNYSGLEDIDKMYIDNVEVEPCSGYTFSTTGLHEVKYCYKPYGFKIANALFQGLDYLIEADLSNLDTSKCTSFGGMFNYCEKLQKLNLSGKFTTRNSTNFRMMFCNCDVLTHIDLSNFKTSKATTLERMFDNCLSVTELDLSTFDFSNITNLSKLFYGNKMLTTIKFSNVNFNESVSYSNAFTSINKNCKLFIDCDNKDEWEKILVTNQATSKYPTTATYGNDGVNKCL